MKDLNLTCPHCYGNVPYGAKVCRGCQAEIEYGAPRSLYSVLLIASTYLGLSFLSWVVGIGVFIVSSILLEIIFKDRVAFNREYKTK